MAQGEPRYYMVRAMEQGEDDFKVFFENSVVAVGWSKVDFTGHGDVEDLVTQVDDIYYSSGEFAPQTAGKKRNEVRRFKGIRPGDRIVVPYLSSIRLATAADEKLYDESVKDSLDLSNQRRVEYLKTDGELLTVPRSRLSSGLQSRLRVPGSTVRDLQEFEEELSKIFEQGSAGDKIGWPASLMEDRHRLEESFKKELLANIQQGNTNLQAGGVGLEKLIKNLLEAEGYQARVLGKRQFPDFADADVLASRDDRILGESKVLVQIKHHGGDTGTWGVEQLKKIRDDDTYKEHRLMLVTSGQASPELKETCDKDSIILIDGKMLVDWIFDALPDLSVETRERLGIINVPSLKL